MGIYGRLSAVLLQILRFGIMTKYKAEQLFAGVDIVKVILFAIVVVIILVVGNGRIY